MNELDEAIKTVLIEALSRLDDINYSVPWIDIINSEVQKIVPGPYIVYIAKHTYYVDGTEQYGQRLTWSWKVIDNSDESILFELRYR